MKNILSDIRDLINHPLKQGSLLEDKNKWNMLCASLDTLGDTDMAIQEYINKKDSHLYLPIYGLLQALFLQSDAINSLYQSLFDIGIDFKEKYPKIYEIRELRNKTIGHPTNFKRSGKTSYYVLNRSSITSEKFQYIKYEPNQSKEFININLHEIIEEYEKIKKNILEEVKEKLELEFTNHKNKFKGEKLIDIIPQTWDYHLSKLYEFKNELEISKINLETVKDVYKKTMDGLSVRYNKIEYLPQGINCVKEEIDFIFEKIESFFQNIGDFDDREIYVYIDQLKSKFEEFQEMFKEVDNEFYNSEK